MLMAKRTFDRDVIRDVFENGEAETSSGELLKSICRGIVGTRRWSVEHEIVFQVGDKHYRTYVSEPATEMQGDYEDYNFGDHDCDEVEMYEKTVTAWRAKS